MGLVIVEELVMNLLFILALTFGGILGVIAILALKAPGQVWAIIKCWMTKRVLVIAATDTTVLKFTARKRREEGQLELKKGNFKSIKIIPRDANPIISTGFHLEGTGIPTYLSYEGKCVAVSPSTLAAIEVVEANEKDKLPKEVKNWAKQQGIKLDVLVKAKDKDKPNTLRTITKKLFSLDPRKLKYYFDEIYDENQFTHMLEEARLEGMGLKPGGLSKAIPIGIIVIALFIIIFLFASGVVPI